MKDTLHLTDHFIALGMAWHLDSGFWNVLLDCCLGWIYVGFKVSQLLWFIV